MAYMANHFDKRCDPALLVEGTRCVVSVALNYYPATRLPEDEYHPHGMPMGWIITTSCVRS